MIKITIDLRHRGVPPDVAFAITENNKQIFCYDPLKNMCDIDFEYYGNPIGRTWVFKGSGFERKIRFSLFLFISMYEDGDLSIDLQEGLPPKLMPLSEKEICESYDKNTIRDILQSNSVVSDEQLTYICKLVLLCGSKDDIDRISPYFPGGMWASLKRINDVMKLCIKYKYTTPHINDVVLRTNGIDETLLQSWKLIFSQC